MLRTFLFGNHKRMKDLEERIGFIARSGLPVLIEGASGTGKEALAEFLHELSGIGGEFTRIVCRKSGSVVQGAWNLGDINRVSCGTVFVKNVQHLPGEAQEQLLAVLEQLSDSHNDRTVPVARLVSSTTQPLDPLAGAGGLNPALYHRLSAYRICLPPLRERREDIPQLFENMVRQAVNGSGAPRPDTSRLNQALMAYDWPGNLRELQNIARTYVVSSRAEEMIEELDSRSRITAQESPAQREIRSLKEQVKGASQKLETEIILRALERHRWNRRRAAETLQISYRSLLYKMKNCNLRPESQMAPEGK